MLPQYIPEEKRYALCIGISQYINLDTMDLEYAASDAQAVAAALADPRRGQFEVTLRITPGSTTKTELENAMNLLLNSSHLKENDFVVMYLSCHGNRYEKSDGYYLLPSNAIIDEDGIPDKTTIIDIYDLTKMLSGAKVKNILVLLDTCYSGAAGEILHHLSLSRNLPSDANLTIIGAARQEQVTYQTSKFQHSIFTHWLLQSFDQKPKGDSAWLTISDIHTYITSEMEQFNQKEPLRTQIQAVSAVVNPNMPLIQNPHYLPGSVNFYNEVKQLLELIQYNPIDTYIAEKMSGGFYIAEVRSGLRMSKVGVIPYDNQIEPLTTQIVEGLISRLQTLIAKKNLDYVLLVTARDPGHEVRQCIRVRFLELRTYNDIWKNLIDFKKYLQKLIREYQSFPEGEDSAPLDKVYIPLNAEFRTYDLDALGKKEAKPDIKKRTHWKKTDIDKMHQIRWNGDAEDAVMRWLNHPDSARLAILADYGSGKTTFCQHLAAKLASQYLTNGDHQHRLPLLIPLLDFAKVPVDLEGYLVSYLKRYCNVDNPDSNALQKMAEAGLLVFILDGFDEMASRANFDTIQQNLALLDKLAHLTLNKVMLTTRPEYFMNLSQELGTLQSYDRLYLQLFDEEQINLYLQKRVPFINHKNRKLVEISRTWEYYRSQIGKIHDLSDLVKRPVLLEMIIKTLPTLIAQDEIINRPNLYQRYLENELDRQLIVKQRRDLQIGREKRFEIMERIAIEMYLSNQAELASNNILEISKAFLSAEQKEEMENSLREILTCSFLVRKEEKYKFSHQSFYEYLVARRLAQDIALGYTESFRSKQVDQGIQGFLLEFERSFQQKNTKNGRVSVADVAFDVSSLLDWFDSYQKDIFIWKNTLSLLLKLISDEQRCKLLLKNADLSCWNFSNTNFSGIDLTETNFSETDLFGANLSHTNLSRASFSRARLSQANLSDSIMGRARLANIDLTYAKFARSYLVGADLRGADLRGANLSGADLSGADLSWANLDNVDLDNVNLTLAKTNNAIITLPSSETKTS